MMESEYLAILPNETEPVDFWERYYYSKARPYVNVLKKTAKDMRWNRVAVTDPTEQFVKKDRQTEQVLRKVHY